MINGQRKILVLVAAVSIPLIFVGLWLAISSSPPAYDERASREPERGGPDIILLENSEKLSKLLLPKQFDVTKKAINDYVKTAIGKTAKKVTIVGDPQISDKGVITLKVLVGSDSSTTFEITIDKWTHYNQLIFSVPSKSYSVILPVYTN